MRERVPTRDELNRVAVHDAKIGQQDERFTVHGICADTLCDRSWVGYILLQDEAEKGSAFEADKSWGAI